MIQYAVTTVMNTTTCVYWMPACAGIMAVGGVARTLASHSLSSRPLSRDP